MKTADLIGPALDWAVCKAGGGASDIRNWISGYWDYGMYHCSTEWSQGGPIIERERIGLDQPVASKPYWTAFRHRMLETDHPARAHGVTPLIAAMRCYVASKLGDEVDVPEELCSPAASQILDEKKPGQAGPSEPLLEVRLQDLEQLVSELEQELVRALGRERELRREQSSQVQPPSPSGS